MKNQGKSKRIGPLDDVRGVRLELRKLYREARRGEIETIDLTRFIGALREMKGCIIAETFEDRIAAMEAAAARRDVA